MNTEEITVRVKNAELQKRSEKLSWIMGQIKKKMAEIGNYLKEIRDDKLYEKDFASFEEFCQANFGFGNKRANQIIAGENIRTMLAIEAANDPEVSAVIPKMKEAALRELATVPPDRRVEVVKEAIRIGKTDGPKMKRAKARVIEGEIVAPGDGKSEYTGHQIEEAASQVGCAGFCPVCKQKLP